MFWVWFWQVFPRLHCRNAEHIWALFGTLLVVPKSRITTKGDGAFNVRAPLLRAEEKGLLESVTFFKSLLQTHFYRLAFMLSHPFLTQFSSFHLSYPLLLLSSVLIPPLWFISLLLFPLLLLVTFNLFIVLHSLFLLIILCNVMSSSNRPSLFVLFVSGIIFLIINLHWFFFLLFLCVCGFCLFCQFYHFNCNDFMWF